MIQCKKSVILIYILGYFAMLMLKIIIAKRMVVMMKITLLCNHNHF